MSEATQPRYGVDPYLDWVGGRLPVAEDYGIDLFPVETGDWPRYGVKGAAVHLKGRGDFCNMFVLDIPPGGSTIAAAAPLRGRRTTCSKAAAARRSNSPTARSAASSGVPKACSPSRSTPSTAFQRQRHASARLLATHHQHADHHERLPQRGLRLRRRFRLHRPRRQERIFSPARAISSRCVPATTCGRPISSPTSPASS